MMNSNLPPNSPKGFTLLEMHPVGTPKRFMKRAPADGKPGADGATGASIRGPRGFEGMQGRDGLTPELIFEGTFLKIRVGDTPWAEVDLKGDPGKDVEFEWRGTSLALRVEGETDWQEVDLQGPAGKDIDHLALLDALESLSQEVKNINPIEPLQSMEQTLQKIEKSVPKVDLSQLVEAVTNLSDTSASELCLEQLSAIKESIDQNTTAILESTKAILEQNAIMMKPRGVKLDSEGCITEIYVK